METIVRRNEYFSMAASYIVDGEKITRTKISFFPKELIEKCKTFDDLVNNDELIDQVLIKKAEASSVDELKKELDEAELFFMSAYKKFGAEKMKIVFDMAKKRPFKV